MEGGQAALNAGQIAHTRHVQAKADHDGGHDADARQRRRDRLGQARRNPDDRHGGPHQDQHEHQGHARQPFTARHAMARRLSRARHLELRQLGQENHDGQPVDKTQHHRMRHQANELAPLHHARENLQKPHQNNRGKEVFDAVLRHQRHHHNGQSPRGPRNHAGATPKNRGDQTHHKGRVKAHQRMNPRDKGKGNGLRHQRQRHRQARKQLGLDLTGGQLDLARRDGEIAKTGLGSHARKIEKGHERPSAGLRVTAGT